MAKLEAARKQREATMAALEDIVNDPDDLPDDEDEDRLEKV